MRSGSKRCKKCFGRDRFQAVFACGISPQRSVELYSSYAIVVVYSHAPEESKEALD